MGPVMVQECQRRMAQHRVAMGRLNLQRDTFALLLCDLELECQAQRLPSPEVSSMQGPPTLIACP